MLPPLLLCPPANSASARLKTLTLRRRINVAHIRTNINTVVILIEGEAARNFFKIKRSKNLGLRVCVEFCSLFTHFWCLNGAVRLDVFCLCICLHLRQLPACLPACLPPEAAHDKSRNLGGLTGGPTGRLWLGQHVTHDTLC